MKIVCLLLLVVWREETRLYCVDVRTRQHCLDLQRMKFVCLLLLVASAWAGEKKPVTKLQIGVKKRIPAEDCPIKTRNGDNLHMVKSSLGAISSRKP